MRRTLALLAWIAAGTLACRDAPAPFAAADREPPFTSGPMRLTYNPRDDRAPVWSPRGDSIYYTAESFDRFPASDGLLLALPSTGGPARVLLDNVQAPTSFRRWLLTPATAPNGELLAYFELFFLWPDFCSAAAAVSCTGGVIDHSNPPLRQGVLRVRRFGETRPPEEDPRLLLEFPGLEVTSDGVPIRYNVRYYPFQRLFTDERALAFRPSWAPDGNRLVISNGLELWIWTVGAASATAIPGITDGVSAAWSPDGEWIAFTRLERGDSIASTCTFQGGFGPVCVQQRTIYSRGPRTLMLIRPDGTGLVELGEGEEPAWSPDSQTLFFRRADQIWRSARDGTGAAPIALTERGREPAVSPDGRSLAFAKRTDGSDYDIWVLPLDSRR